MTKIDEINKLCQFIISLTGKTASQDLTKIGQDLHIDGRVIASKMRMDNNDGYNPLHLAAYKGNLDEFNTTIQTHDPTWGNNDGWTPFHLAAQEGHTNIMIELLKTRKLPPIQCGNNAGFTPLHAAAWGGSVEILELLHKYGLQHQQRSVKGWTPLHCAIWNNKIEAVRFLVSQEGCDLSFGDQDWVRPLHIAAFLKDPQIAAFLVEKGANLSDKTKTHVSPLHIAVLLGNIEMTKLLTPNVEKISDTILDITAFHIAAYMGNIEILRYFIAKAPSANAIEELKQDINLSPAVLAILNPQQKNYAIASATVKGQELLKHQDTGDKDDVRKELISLRLANLQLILQIAKEKYARKDFKAAYQKCLEVVNKHSFDDDITQQTYELMREIEHYVAQQEVDLTGHI